MQIKESGNVRLLDVAVSAFLHAFPAPLVTPPDACEPASAAVLLFFVMLGFQLVSPARDPDAPVNTVQFAVVPTSDILLDQTPPMSAVIYAQLDDKNSAPKVEIEVMAATNGAMGRRGRPLLRLFFGPSSCQAINIGFIAASAIEATDCSSKRTESLRRTLLGEQLNEVCPITRVAGLRCAAR
jgi:hypothetical protein